MKKSLLSLFLLICFWIVAVSTGRMLTSKEDTEEFILENCFTYQKGDTTVFLSFKENGTYSLSYLDTLQNEWSSDIILVPGPKKWGVIRVNHELNDYFVMLKSQDTSEAQSIFLVIDEYYKGMHQVLVKEHSQDSKCDIVLEGVNQWNGIYAATTDCVRKR